MHISIVCSDPKHPVNPYLKRWAARQSAGHVVSIVHQSTHLSKGDILFLVACHEIISPAVRAKFGHTLVLHASDLPKGRGWSPVVWQVLEGARKITVTLLEAADHVDTGAIWKKEVFELEGHELLDEINAKLFAVKLSLMDFALANAGKIDPQPQDHHGATYYRRRTPEDSRLDPEKSIAAQFDLLRIADPVRYPAFFDYRGHRYLVRLEKWRYRRSCA